VTDANLLLGRFGGASLLGGDFRLDTRRAAEVFEKLAREMSAAGGRAVSAREAAEGVVRVVNAGMERALRAVSVERGHDPRRFTLLSFGGAGGLHAVELARALRSPRVVVPRSPGALSALGALSSDVVKDLSRTVMLEASDRRSDALLRRAFRQMEREARAALRREGFRETQQRIEHRVAARYKGQSFELEIEWAGIGFDGEFDGEEAMGTSRRTPLAALVESFHDAHQRRYGYAERASVVEIVTARVRAVGVVEKLKEAKPSRVRLDAETVSPSQRAKVYLTDGRARVIGVYARDALKAGARLRSPCIVGEYSSTTLVPAGARAHIDRHGNLIIEP
jgi:N-methylhydantoinase A